MHPLYLAHLQFRIYPRRRADRVGENCALQRSCVTPAAMRQGSFAQVADIADVVRQQADALMLCGETAAGLFPDKCVGVLRAVATSIEEWCR